MSIEQKIAELLEESKKLQAEETIALPEEFAEMTLEELEEFVVSEEFEQLDELSKGTLRSYINKAGTQVLGAAGRKLIGMKFDNKQKAKLIKRGDSVDNAVDKLKAKLKKEELELTIDVSEDVAALVNGEELSEEFKTKAATIFEAAVVTRVKQEIAKLEEEFDTQLAEQVESIKEGLVEKVDGYLNYVVEQWMTDNELALENGMKTEIMESFVAGMKGLFEQHYIDVPEEKFDVISDLQEEAEFTKAKLDEQLAANVELTKQINEMKRVAEITQFSSDMADTDAEKFKGLAEELAYEDTQSFKTKLQTIKENYFGKKVSPTVGSVVTDEPVLLDEEKKIDPVMAGYLKALAK